MLGEAFTVLAVLEATDRMSRVLEKIDSGLNGVAESAARAAEVTTEAGAKMDESLLQTASGADALSLADARLQVAQDKVAAAAEAQANAERALLEAQAKLRAGEEDQVSGSAQMQAAAERLATAQRQAAAAARELTAAEERQAAIARAQADANTTAAVQTDAAAAAQTRLRGSADQAAAGAAIISKAMKYGALGIAAVGYESVKAASKFQSTTTRLVTSAGESEGALNQVRTGLVDMAGQVGVTANDLGKAMYYVEAAGYRASDGLTVLKAAAQGAAAEGADTTTVAQALTDVLKDYHLSAASAGTVTSQMVAAISHGKVNLEDFSKAFASIVPAASAAGISFNDAGAALAEMTNHGFTAQRGAQNLAQALRSLLNPTKPMQTAFKEFGVSADELKNKLHGPNGLTDGMEYLAQAAAKAGKEGTPEFAAALKRLMGTAAGANAALTTTGQNFSDTQKTIKAMAGATTDAQGRVKGFAEVQHTFGQQMKMLGASVDAAGISIGTALLPMLTQVAQAVAHVVTPIAQWISHHQKLVGLMATFLGTAVAVVGILKAWEAVQKVLTAVTLAFAGAEDAALAPEILIVAAIAAIVAAVIYAYTHFKTFRDVVNTVMSAVKVAAVAVAHAVVAAWNWLVTAGQAVWHALQAAWTGVVGGVMALWHGIEGAWNAIVSVTTTVWNSIAGFFQKWWPLLLVIFMPFVALVISIWNHFHEQIIGTAKTVWGAITGFFTGVWHGIETVARTVWNLIYLAVVKPVEAVWHFIQPVLHAIESFLSSAWNNILAGARTIWNLVKAALINPITGAWHTITSTVSKIASAIGSGLSKAWTAVENIGSKFLSIGSSIVEGIIHGVENAASSLFGSMKNLASSALNAAKSALGINSPSKVFASVVGVAIPEGIAKGVDDHAHLAHTAVKKMTAALPTAASASFTGSTKLGIQGPALSALGGGAGAGANIFNLHVHLEGSHIMSDRDTDVLVQKIGRAISTRTLPQAGVRIRM